MADANSPLVVIIGGGFGGLTAAQSLAHTKVQVRLLDRTNHHLFQPLLYQVAIAGLSPAEIASPIRSILASQKNACVLLAEATSIDLANKTIHLADGEQRYDYLILATGAKTTYFGHDEWEPFAPGLKSLDDAVEIRRRVLLAFERAERATDPATRKMLLTFVVIGGGPTGVELAGSISELARYVLTHEFRSIDPNEAKVILIEAGPRVLAAFDPSLSQKTVDQLSELGVEVRTGCKVTKIDAEGVRLGTESGDAFIETSTVVWGAGVCPTPITKTLGVPLDRAGRVIVEKDCSVPGHPDAFVIGDAAGFMHQGGKPLPGVSAVAMQQARFVARVIGDRIDRTLPQGPTETFEYTDKGSMATIGRSRAVVEIGRVRWSGWFAWVTWLVVHIWYLIGYRNRIAVMLTWFWSYVTYHRGARLITGIKADEESPLSRRRPRPRSVEQQPSPPS